MKWQYICITIEQSAYLWLVERSVPEYNSVSKSLNGLGFRFLIVFFLLLRLLCTHMKKFGNFFTAGLKLHSRIHFRWQQTIYEWIVVRGIENLLFRI